MYKVSFLPYPMRVFKNADSAKNPVEIKIPAIKKSKYLPRVVTVFLSFRDRAKIRIKSKYDINNISPAKDKRLQANNISLLVK